MARQPEKSSSELSNSSTSPQPSQPTKKTKTAYVGGFVPDSVKRIVEEKARTSGRSQSEVIRDALTRSSVGPVPEGIRDLAYSLVPMTLSEDGQAIQATRTTGQLGIKTTLRGPDRRVIEAERHQTAASNENLVWAYNNSVALRATLHLIAQTIIGAGWSIDSEDEAAKKLIEDFADNTNLPEWIEATVENLAIFGNNINALKENKLIYIDWSGMYVFKHPETGEVRYLQSVKIPSDLPKTDRDWVKFDIKAYHSSTDEKVQSLDPEDVIHAKIGARGFEVGQSLIAPIITLVVYEKLIQWFMVQGAEIYGSPRIIASLELGEMPLAEDQATKQAIQDQMSLISAALQNFRNFGVLTMPPGWKVDIYGPGEHMMNYETILGYIRREIMLSCLGSTALFEAKGTELATSRTIETVWGYGLDGWRRVLKNTLDTQVFPKITDSDVEINFNSEKKWTATEGRDLVQAGIITKEEAREEWGYPEQPTQPGPTPGSESPYPPGMTPVNPPIPADQVDPPAPKGWGELVGTIPAGKIGLELSNHDAPRPKRSPTYEQRIRAIEEKTAKSCDEVFERSMEKIKGINKAKATEAEAKQ